MSVVNIEIPCDAIRLTGIVDIRNWLTDINSLPLEQLAIDWIEKYIDKANGILEADGIQNTDEEFRSATHYEVQTILQVLRPTATCWQFFVDLESLTRSRERNRF